jgi:predicted amidohydrolase
VSKIAIAQMCSTADFEKNLKTAKNWIQKAKEEGAKLIAFPENFLFLGSDKKNQELAQSIHSPLVQQFQKDAKEAQISILLGSIPEQIDEDTEKAYNTSILIQNDGELIAQYRKIHLFDIRTPQLVLEESKRTKAGKEIVVVDHEIGKLGFSICYDIRFPNLFQKLRKKGAEIIFAPSAFTLQTGKDHWLPLLKARAIENQVYIVAPAQWGHHNEKRVSFGSSVLIDPWGTVVSKASEKEELIFGNIDLDYLKAVREKMPIEDHKVSSIDYS